MKRIGVFLIIVALVAGMSGCDSVLPGFTSGYSIRISTSIGGAVTSPGEGLFQYARGTVVNLVAEPEMGYEFDCWVSNAGTIADIYDATTTISISQNFCFVTASFHE